MRFILPLILAGTQAVRLGQNEVGLSSGTMVGELTDLDPTIKVLAHLDQGTREQVILVRPDRSVFSMRKHNGVFVEDSADLEIAAALRVFENEYKFSVIKPKELGNHPILEISPDSGAIRFENKLFEPTEMALMDPAASQLITPLLRVDAFRGTERWGHGGSVVFHSKDSGHDRIVMLSSDYSRFLVLRRDGTEWERDSVAESDETRLTHLQGEIGRRNIHLEILGQNSVIVKIGDKGFSVLSLNGARFVPAGSSALRDPVLGPWIAIDQRIKCHSVPKIDGPFEGSLEDDYKLVAHYILNGEFMIVKRKGLNGSIYVLTRDEGETAFRVKYPSASPDYNESFYIEAARKLAESVSESVAYHTVYEFLEDEKSFAMHYLFSPVATIVQFFSQYPVTQFIAKVGDQKLLGRIPN